MTDNKFKLHEIMDLYRTEYKGSIDLLDMLEEDLEGLF